MDWNESRATRRAARCGFSALGLMGRALPGHFSPPRMGLFDVAGTSSIHAVVITLMMISQEGDGKDSAGNPGCAGRSPSITQSLERKRPGRFEARTV